MLREIGLSDSRRLAAPRKNRVYVARHRGNDEIAPPEKLFREFKKKSTQLGGTVEAHNAAFKAVHYERKFRKHVLGNPAALKKLEAIARRARNRDIYFICYEGPAKACHRRILLRICEDKFHARVKVEGVEP